MRPRAAVNVLVLTVLSAALAGCPGPAPGVGAKAPPVVDQVGGITMFVPGVENADDRPGVDGVRVNVCFFKSRAEPIPVQPSGTVEFVLYEGSVLSDQIGRAKPLRSWQFTSAQLQAYRAVIYTQPGYSVLLRWDANNPPRTQWVTVAAIYRAPDGTRTVSEAHPLQMG